MCKNTHLIHKLGFILFHVEISQTFVLLLHRRANLQFESRACVIQAYYLEITLHWQQVLDEVDEGHSDWLLGSLVDQSECWNSLHVFCRKFTWQINTGTHRGTRTGKDRTPHDTHTHTDKHTPCSTDRN